MWANFLLAIYQQKPLEAYVRPKQDNLRSKEDEPKNLLQAEVSLGKKQKVLIY